MSASCEFCGYPSSPCAFCGSDGIGKEGFSVTGPGRTIGSFWSAPGRNTAGEACEIVQLVPGASSQTMDLSQRLSRALAKPAKSVQRVLRVGIAEGRLWAALDALPSNTLNEVMDTRGKLSTAAASYVALVVLEALEGIAERKESYGVITPSDLSIAPDRHVTVREPAVCHTLPDDPTPYRAPSGSGTLSGDIYCLGRLLAYMLSGSPQALPTEKGQEEAAQLLRLLCALDANLRLTDTAALREIFLLMNRNESFAEPLNAVIARNTNRNTPPAPRPKPVVDGTIKPTQGELVPETIPTPVVPAPAPTPAARPVATPPPPPTPKNRMDNAITMTPPPPPPPRGHAHDGSTTVEEGATKPFKERVLHWAAIYTAILINALILLFLFILILRKVI